MRDKLSKNELLIYSKQINLEQVGIEGQIRLKQSKVLVIGLGGLGCPVTMYLGISGVGCIGIMDNDNVEKSNLGRQMLYEIEDVTRSKIECATKKLRKINEKCLIIKHNYRINVYNSIETISYYDIIIDTTDNFATRYIIDKACYKLNKTYIYGAINEFDGQVGVFNYKSGIRYSDLYKEELNLKVKNCNLSGVMGAHSGYIGNLQALEAIKIILGICRKCQNSLTLQKTLEMETKKKKIYPNRKRVNKSVDKKKLLNNNKYLKIKDSIHPKSINYITLDLRQKNEFKQKHVKKSMNVSLSQLKRYKTIKFLRDSVGISMINIYCNDHIKSSAAYSILRKSLSENEKSDSMF